MHQKHAASLTAHPVALIMNFGSEIEGFTIKGIADLCPKTMGHFHNSFLVENNKDYLELGTPSL